jgi:hypothetical protein
MQSLRKSLIATSRSAPLIEKLPKNPSKYFQFEGVSIWLSVTSKGNQWHLIVVSVTIKIKIKKPLLQLLPSNPVLEESKEWLPNKRGTRIRNRRETYHGCFSYCVI